MIQYTLFSGILIFHDLDEIWPSKTYELFIFSACVFLLAYHCPEVL